jgi:hypothetical protein
MGRSNKCKPMKDWVRKNPEEAERDFLAELERVRVMSALPFVRFTPGPRPPPPLIPNVSIIGYVYGGCLNYNY